MQPGCAEPLVGPRCTSTVLNQRAIVPVVVVLAAVAFAMMPAAAALAADPSPTAAPSSSSDPSVPPNDGPPAVEAWLDQPIPIAARPGSRIGLGIVLWDPRSKAVASPARAIFVRVHPATTEVKPLDVSAPQNWHGHYTATIEVPDDGLGPIEFGVPGTMCDDSGCQPSDWLFPIAGIGPPPGAPVTSLATAAIDPPPAPLVAGQPIDITIRLRPNAGLDPELFAMPETLMIRAHPPRGPIVATAVLTPVASAGAADAEYAGSLTIPVAGDTVLEAATDADGGDATRFGTSLTRVIVDAAPDAPVAASGETPWLALAAVLLAVGAVIVVGGSRGAGRRSSGR